MTELANVFPINKNVTPKLCILVESKLSNYVQIETQNTSKHGL